jgi:hypothetical protein
MGQPIGEGPPNPAKESVMRTALWNVICNFKLLLLCVVLANVIDIVVLMS